MDSSGLGWFCIWVAIIALFYMVVSFVQFHDVVNALTWFMWALLWYLFFVLNAQKRISINILAELLLYNHG